ncbi:MAG: DNA repair protein RecO [Ruminococcus sp.]|nr:DNA repair protein RecO [Ruminococcus sp.]
MTTLKGLILKEEARGESSKSITVLTAERGIIRIFVRGGLKSSKNGPATQSYSLSSLCMEEKKDAKGQVSYYLNSSEPVKLFYNIRLDAARVALAAYFAELLIFTGTEGEESGEIMRLALNTMYFLDKGEMDRELLKSVFEFRLLCESGLRPALLGCRSCYRYEDDSMYFDFLNNDLECSGCCENPESIHAAVLDRQLLYIVRFIALTEYERLFSFRISQRYQEKLTAFTERFVRYHLKSSFAALEFYRMIT